MTEEIKMEILSQLQSQISTNEEIENMKLPYDHDRMYAYGQRAGLEEAIEIVKDVFNDFGF